MQTRELFTFRLGTARDLPACVDLLRPGDPARKYGRSLVPLWHRCLGRGAFIVIDEANPGGAAGPQGFGLSVFVRDAFADSCFCQPRPSIGAEFYDALARGGTVLLSEQEVAQANSAAGINVLVLHFGSRHTDFSKPETLSFHRLIGPSFLASHGGHRIRSTLAETYGPDATYEATTNGPMRLLADFSADDPPRYDGVPTHERPSLVGLRAEWVKGTGWYPYSELFDPPTPVIYFRRSERLLLERALTNESDASVACALGVSLDTVKKTWRSAFARASAALPALFPGVLETESVRGNEKRRHLLYYLRTHLEELRPYPRPEASVSPRVPIQRSDPRPRWSSG